MNDASLPCPTQARTYLAVRAFVDLTCALVSLFMVFVELHLACEGVALSREIHREALFLSRYWGRGLFYMLLGTFALTGLMREEVFTLVGGFALLGAGVLDLVVGALAEYALAGTTGGVSYEDALEAFNAADDNQNGQLECAEFPQVVAKLGPCPTASRLLGPEHRAVASGLQGLRT